jgi:hypothetical protein
MTTTLRTDITTGPISEVQAQIARVDTKASILFGLSLAALTGGTALGVTAHLHGVAVVSAGFCACLIGAALTLLGSAVRPALGGNYGFVRWANAANVVALRQDLSGTDCVDARVWQLWRLAQSVQRKYRRVRLAVDLLGVALAGAFLTAILAGLGW